MAWPQLQGRPGNATQVNYLAAELPFLNCCWENIWLNPQPIWQRLKMCNLYNCSYYYYTVLITWQHKWGSGEIINNFSLPVGFVNHHHLHLAIDWHMQDGICFHMFTSEIGCQSAWLAVNPVTHYLLWIFSWCGTENNTYMTDGHHYMTDIITWPTLT